MFKLNQEYMALLDIPNTTIKGGDIVTLTKIEDLGLELECTVLKEYDEVFKILESKMQDYFFDYSNWSFEFKEVLHKKQFFINKKHERDIKLKSSEYLMAYREDCYNKEYFMKRVSYHYNDKECIEKLNDGVTTKEKKVITKRLNKLGFDVTLEPWWQKENGFKYSKRELIFFNKYIARYLKLIENLNKHYLKVFNYRIVSTLKSIQNIKHHSSEKDTLIAIQSSEKVFKVIYENVKSIDEAMAKKENLSL